MRVFAFLFFCLFTQNVMAIVCPEGYLLYYLTAEAQECRIICNGGTYLANAKDTKCTNVGAGYWAPKSLVKYGNAGIRNKCEKGLTTIGYGTGADQADDCGRVLNVGGDKLYLRKQSVTKPAFNVLINGDIYYGNIADIKVNMSEPVSHRLGIYYDGQEYSVYDDSMSETVQILSTKFDYNDYNISDGKLLSVSPDVYLESTDSQFIDTGLYGNTNYKYELVFQQTEKLSAALWGVRYDPIYNKGDILTYSWSSQIAGRDTVFFIKNHLVSKTFINGNNLNKNIFVLDIPKRTAKLNNTVVSFSSPGDWVSKYTLFLFTNSVAGTPAASAKLKVYSYKVYNQDNVLLQHLVPVAVNMVIGDFVVPENGMWDIVTQKFLPNSGEGYFIYGKDKV